MSKVLMVAVTLLAPISNAVGQTMTVTSSAQSGGPTATALAQDIIDEGADYSLVSGSVTTVINASGNPSSSPRAMGTFQNGMVAAGTPLPAANNVTPAVTYSGGIGLSQGVCLCTGAATDR